MPLDHLWATWRSHYVSSTTESRATAPDGAPPDGRTLFERILAAPGHDRDKLVVHTGPTCFVLLNRFPYTAGALMVLPRRGVGDLEALNEDEHTELWATVRDAVVATKAAFAPDACNVGINLGEAAGGSQSDHLHVHVVPRWVGDANFMTAVAETRTLPIGLGEAWDRLRAVWPSGSPDSGSVAPPA